MKTISTEELRTLIDEGRDFTLLNVLPEETYRKEHIPGSRNVPEDRGDFVDEVSRLVPEKNAKIVVYCANEECQASPRAAKKLEEAGFSNVYDYTGGMETWKKEGREVIGAA